MNRKARHILYFVYIFQDVAKDCLRVDKLQVFSEFLCGVREPLLEYDVQKQIYISLGPGIMDQQGASDAETDSLHNQVSMTPKKTTY